MISPMTALLLGGAALLIFGPKRLPEVARSLGRSVSEFKAGADEAREAFRQGAAPVDPPARDGEPRNGA